MQHQVFRLSVCDAFSVSGGGVNDDVVGHVADTAWVIDGATDIGDVPLVDSRSDAAWFAATLDDWLRARALDLPPRLEDVLPDVTEHAAQEFARLARRPPTGRFEHPSAAGLLIRVAGPELEYVALGDCSLLVEAADGAVVRYGITDDEAGDAWLSQHLSTAARQTGPDAEPDPTQIRARLLPTLRKARERMNLLPGYGVFSITPPPQQYVTCDRIPVREGARLLLASDGFMRLVDVFAEFSVKELLAETFEHGVSKTIEHLRRVEEQDARCERHPRAKRSDDASALLVTIVPGA